MLDLVSVLGWLVVLYYVVYTLVFYFVQEIRVLINHFRPTNFVKKYGQWAVVTGCTDGIGLAYARELARRGMNVVLISRSKDKLEAVARQIVYDFHVKTKIVAVDFNEGSNIYQNIAKDIFDLDIGVLVNNVGVGYTRPKLLEEVSEQMIWSHVNVNVGAATSMTSLVLPGMKTRRRGAIINISSILGISPVPFLSVYSATKAYINHLSAALRYECSDSGVTVQTVVPGFVHTRMLGLRRKLPMGVHLVVPSPTIFVKHAMQTLGVYDFTSGYFFHEFKAIFASLSPSWLWMNLTTAFYGKISRRPNFRNRSG